MVEEKKTPKAARTETKRKLSTALTGHAAKSRDEVCVEPKYPGSPSDYRYVSVEYCTPIDGKKAALKKEPIDKRDLRTELKRVEGELQDKYGKRYKDEDSDDLDLHKVMVSCTKLVNYMLNARARARFPDPLARLAEMQGRFEKINASEYFNAARYTALKIVRTHLLTVIG
jgi:hypothetical protein